MEKNAFYVSIWDGGTRVETPCHYNPITKVASEIGSVEGDELNILDDEFVEYDGEEIHGIINGDDYDFTIDHVRMFLEIFGEEVKNDEPDGYAELMMDDHICITFEGKMYYVREDSVLYDETEYSIVDYFNNLPNI